MIRTCLRLAIAVFALAATQAFAQDDGFAFPVNAENYPTPTIIVGEDFLFEAEQALRVFGDDVPHAPEDVYQVIEGDDFSNSKAVQFILDDAGGRFEDWDLHFPFILEEETEVRIAYRISFFTDPDGGEGKAYVKMDDNENDAWPPGFFGFDPAVFEGDPFPPDDGGGWIQINNWSNFQRQNFGDQWGENGDFRTIWAEGNWFDQVPEVEMLAWLLPAGEHVFKMTPRSGGNLSIDYVAVITDEFDRFAEQGEIPTMFDFDPSQAQALDTTTDVDNYMFY